MMQPTYAAAKLAADRIHPRLASQSLTAYSAAARIATRPDAAILAALIDLAENWLGLTRLELTVYADNAAAIGLYRKFGFVAEGTHVGYALREGVMVDALAMARRRG